MRKLKEIPPMEDSMSSLLCYLVKLRGYQIVSTRLCLSERFDLQRFCLDMGWTYIMHKGFHGCASGGYQYSLMKALVKEADHHAT